MISLVDTFDLTAGGSSFGTITEKFFSLTKSFTYADAKGVEIAASEKVDWISTDVTIRRPDGRVIAALHRPWFNFLSDNWAVKISDHSAVDSRLIVMIAAYKTSVDNDRRREESDSDK